MWQANLVKDLLSDIGYASTLVAITSEGDTDQVTPLYEMGVQGIFTKSLDAALLNDRIDIAVHSMKDVPTALPAGISQAAVLKRGNPYDIFVPNQHSQVNDGLALQDFHRSLSISEPLHLEDNTEGRLTIATSSVRRRAQWLHRYPRHELVNLRGNINTRMQKISGSNWDGAILAAAGLERIDLRPSSAIELPWMLPAPAQGAIMVVCRSNDAAMIEACKELNHADTVLCTEIEKDFLRTLMGGCSTPIAALAIRDKNEIYFKGNMLTPDGKEKIEIERYVKPADSLGFGTLMAVELLKNGGKEISDKMKHGR